MPAHGAKSVNPFHDPNSTLRAVHEAFNAYPPPGKAGNRVEPYCSALIDMRATDPI